MDRSNLIAEFVDDSENAYLFEFLNEDGTPSQGVIARTQVYRSEDVPDLRAVNIQLGWSDDRPRAGCASGSCIESSRCQPWRCGSVKRLALLWHSLSSTTAPKPFREIIARRQVQGDAS